MKKQANETEKNKCRKCGQDPSAEGWCAKCLTEEVNALLSGKKKPKAPLYKRDIAQRWR